MKVKVAQSCPTLCDPMDYIVNGILQARILEWVAYLFSSRSSPDPGIEPGSPALQADMTEGLPLSHIIQAFILLKTLHPLASKEGSFNLLMDFIF